MEPLKLLRDFFVNEREYEILVGDDEVKIGNKKFSLNQATNYRVLFNPAKMKDSHDFYTIGAILYFLENGEDKHSEYVRKAREKNIQVVELADKKSLLAYLKGEISQPNAVDKDTPNPPAPKRTRTSSEGNRQPAKVHRYDKIPVVENNVSAKSILKKKTSFESTDSPMSPDEVASNPRRASKKPLPDSSLQPSTSKGAAASQASYMNPKKARGRFEPKKYWIHIPIIIVPREAHSLITIRNAQEILENLNFVESDEDKDRRSSFVSLIIMRNKRNARLPELFHVVDNPMRLEPDEWDRVVGIFVTDRNCQFKKWPYTQEQILEKFPLFHLKYVHNRTDPNIVNWPLNLIRISKTDRLINTIAIARFWEKLDAHLVDKP